MRAWEFLAEDELGDFIEDEADSRGDGNLASTLDMLRFQARDTHEVPMIRVDALINLVRSIPGTEMFTVENLMDAYKTNETIKNLISGIKDNKDGVKYVYLKTFGDEEPDENPEVESIDDDELRQDANKKTVDAMAKRALSKRAD